jgi:hypothetical protein
VLVVARPQTELAFKKLGVQAVVMSAGELESEVAGQPGRLIRERYRSVHLPTPLPLTTRALTCMAQEFLRVGFVQGLNQSNDTK